MQPETRYARSGNVHIAYQLLGQGPSDLVLIPNWFSNVEIMWQHPRNERLLRTLASMSRLILFDQRGSGASDPAAIEDMIVLEERAADILAVLDTVGSEKATIMAAGMASSLGCFFAAAHSERTRSLIIPDGWARRASPEELEELEEMLRSIPERWGTPEFLESRRHDRSMSDWLAFYRRMSMGPGAAQAMFRAMLDLDVTHLLSAIHVPTLIIHHIDADLSDVDRIQQLADGIEDSIVVRLEGVGGSWFSADPGFLPAIERFLLGESRPAPADRVLATVVFTDVVGSTELAARLGDKEWLNVLDVHAGIVARETSRHGGRLIQTEGDGALMTFDGPARAIRCASAIRDASKTVGIDLRAGMHTGEVELRGNDIGGIAVHIGARVSALAGPGEVLVSSTVKDLVMGSGISLEDRGTHTLKGVPDQWRIYAVSG